MNQDKAYLMWGERGLIATFFADLCQIEPENSFAEFLSTVDFQKPLPVLPLIPKRIEYIIEPDFAEFGHPDAVIALEYEQAGRVVFILEAKRISYLKACSPKAQRGTSGFNSRLNGQLELDYRLAVALSHFGEGNTELREPKGFQAPYEPFRNTSRKLANPAVLSAVVSRLCGASLDHYFYLVVTCEDRNPLDIVGDEILPDLFKPELRGMDVTSRNCWTDMRSQFGWLNYRRMLDFVKSHEPNMANKSYFLPSYALNQTNMGQVGTDEEEDTEEEEDGPEQPVRTGRGVSMIHAPDINETSFLHFSWKGQACALRDYSQSSVHEPLPDRQRSTLQVEQMIQTEVRVPHRSDIHAVGFWHNRTKELNAQHLK